MTSYDAVVLGAGIVGVATAIQLRKRGLSVALVDRRGPGEETSHGNAGLIQREGVHPYVFPRDPRTIIGVALKWRTDADYHLSSLPSVAPFLLRYFAASSPERARKTFEANIPLFARCLEAHEALMAEAGSQDLVRKTGWIKLFRKQASAQEADVQARELREIGLAATMLDGKALNALEPDIDTSKLTGGLHYGDPWCCSNPGALVKSYAALYEKLGGETVTAEIAGVERRDGRWVVTTNGPDIAADQLVVTLGPWSKRLLDAVGVNLPMGVKRGYHRHYAPQGEAKLNRPVLDGDVGYVMAPMARGVRLTSGAEFARQDAPATPRQLQRVLPRAREVFPLGESVDERAWLGARPVLPDMLPVIGAAPKNPGLWLHFGHAHHGFTLGPATAELVSQLIAGETPYCDPAPYNPQRFTRSR